MKRQNEPNLKFNLYDYIPSGICIIDKEFVIVFINYTFAEWFNIKKDIVIGKKIDFIFPKFKEERYKLRIKTVFQYGPPLIFSPQLHKNLFKQPDELVKHNSIYHTIITSLPLGNSSEKESLAIFTIEDVTELTKRIDGYRVMKDKNLAEIKNRKVIEKKLLLAKDIAEREKVAADNASKSKSNFLANMSHEFRTPLNSILGFSSLLLEKNEFNNQSKEFLYSIESSGKMLLSLINDILDLSKVEAGLLVLDFVLVNFESLLYEIETTFKNSLDKKGIKFYIDYNKESLPAFIFIDEIRFKQIIFNLLSNAFKFTEKGYIKIKIVTENIDETTINLFISVEDTGKGIAEDQMKKIFEEFVQHRGQNYSKYSGTGLGLSITKKLLKNMNGKIFLKSKINYGSTFTVELKNLKISNKNKDQFSKLSEEDNKRNRRAADTQIKQKNEEFFLNHLSEEEYLLLSNILTEKLLPEWKRILTTYNIDQIKIFAKSIIEVGDKFNLDFLRKYGKETFEYAESISLEKLLPHLELFSDKINKILNNYKNENYDKK